MTKTRTRIESASRLIVALGAVWAIAGCDGADTVGEEGGETTSAIVNGHPAGGVGVVKLRISNLKVARDGTIIIEECTGTVIAGNRIITAGHCADVLTLHDGGDTTVLLQGDLFAQASYNDGRKWVCLTNLTEDVCTTNGGPWVPVHVSRIGNGDIPPDIGVVRFASPLQRIQSADFRLLSTRSIRATQSVEEWGAGFINVVGSAGGSASPAMTKAVVRITSVAATSFKLPNDVSQICKGDSGGPVFAGPSDLIVGILASGPVDSRGKCASTTGQTTAYRITPSVITFLNNNRQGSDPVCHETIAGTGFFSCT
jgi:hypothetical protein